jgi:hypothetical protein
MNIVLRYACLLGLGLASLLAFISAGSITGQLVMAGSHSGMVRPQEMSLWVLGVIVVISLWSVFRFMFGRFPLMLRDWYHNHKEKMATLAMAGVVCFVFVVL